LACNCSSWHFHWHCLLQSSFGSTCCPTFLICSLFSTLSRCLLSFCLLAFWLRLFQLRLSFRLFALSFCPCRFGLEMIQSYWWWAVCSIRAIRPVRTQSQALFSTRRVCVCSTRRLEK
jgi:hypothetical protein